MKNNQLKILWVKSGPLHPLDTGGKIRTYNMLKELRKKHKITFLTLEHHSAVVDWKEKSLEYCHDLVSIAWEERARPSFGFYLDLVRNILFSNRPYVIDKYLATGMRSAISKLDEGCYDLIVCDFLTPAVNISDTTKTPTILFEHNVESEIWRRHYERSKRNILSGIYFYFQWRRMLSFEKECCERFKGVVTVSPKDSDTLCNMLNVRNVIGDVPAGVDLDYFKPLDVECIKPPRLVFIGSMDWMPNEDAANYFVREIYPKIKYSVPDATLTIAGRNPSQCLREMAAKDQSICVTGTVEDIRPFVQEAMIIVVPLRIGGGTRIKIFEGMAMGVPIVSTNIGAEGLPVTHGTNIILADDPDAFASETIRLFCDPKLRKTIADSALGMVRDEFSWQAVSRTFETYCFQVLSETKRRSKKSEY